MKFELKNYKKGKKR